MTSDAILANKVRRPFPSQVGALCRPQGGRACEDHCPNDDTNRFAQLPEHQF